MSGSPGDRNRPGAGGDSHPNKKRKFDLDSDEGQRQRARDAYKLLENIQDVKSRGGPAFPPATEGQLHHVQVGFAQLETYQDGFNLDGPTGQVNWIEAVSHVNSATWGSRMALDNADALAALLSTMQAIGARENAPTVRLAMIFESDTEGNNHNNNDASTAAAGKPQNVAGPSNNTSGMSGPSNSNRFGVKDTPFMGPPPIGPHPHGLRDGSNAPQQSQQSQQGKATSIPRGPPAPSKMPTRLPLWPT